MFKSNQYVHKIILTFHFDIIPNIADIIDSPGRISYVNSHNNTCHFLGNRNKQLWRPSMAFWSTIDVLSDDKTNGTNMQCDKLNATQQHYIKHFPANTQCFVLALCYLT